MTHAPARTSARQPAAPARAAVRPARHAPASGLVLQRCACGGGCPACRTKATPSALPINTPGDAFEREAERAADAVMSASPAPLSRSSAGPALRRCACGGACPSCRRKEEEELRREDAGTGDAPGFAPPVVHHVLAAPGRPLEDGVRGRMEERFGADFGGVRVHDDARAAASARAVDAHAYTVGSNVVFAAGRYAPGTAAGDRLIAHELAHTLQQGGAGVLRRQAVEPEPRVEPPEPPPNAVTIDLLDPLNSSARIGGFGLPSPRDVLNGLDRMRRFGQPPPTPANPLPPPWPVPALTPEDTRRAACAVLPALCNPLPGAGPPPLGLPQVSPPVLPVPQLQFPQLQQPLVLFHARKVLDHFTYDETGVPDRHRGELDRTATELIDTPALVTDITGHTDTRGDPAHNQLLSERRARAVRSYLVDRQVPLLQIWSETGAGENHPAFPNDATDHLAAARNRRVELEIRRMIWRLTLPGGPGPGSASGATPALSLTDPRVRVRPADAAAYARLRTFLATVRGEITAVLATTPPREPWAVPDNENVVAMLGVLDDLNVALAAERHVVRFDLPTTGTTGALYQFPTDEIHLRPIGSAADLADVAGSLVHEYTHHRQDVTAEQLLRARRVPLEHTRADELRQETEARRNQVYFERLISLAGRPMGFGTLISSGLLLADFERERTGSPAVQARARADIRHALEGPYAAQLAANAPSRRYLVEIRPNRHAVLIGVGGVETDLGAVPPSVTTRQHLEAFLATQVEALPTRAALFRGPSGQALVVIQFNVFDAGQKVADFALRP